MENSPLIHKISTRGWEESGAEEMGAKALNPQAGQSIETSGKLEISGVINKDKHRQMS